MRGCQRQALQPQADAQRPPYFCLPAVALLHPALQGAGCCQCGLFVRRLLHLAAAATAAHCLHLLLQRGLDPVGGGCHASWGQGLRRANLKSRRRR